MTTDPRQLAQEALVLDTAAQDAHPSTPVGALAQLERLGRLYDMCQPFATALLAALDERDELRLTLAAEQGKPEGAPSARWAWRGDHWQVGPDTDVEARAWPGGRLYLRDPKRICGTLTEHGTARAATIFADAKLEER